MVQKNRVFAILMLIVVVFTVFMSFTTPVYADNERPDQSVYCNVCKTTHKVKFKTGLGKVAFEFHNDTVSGNLFTDTTKEILKLDLTGENGASPTFNQKIGEAFVKIWSALKAPYNTIAVTGKILVVILVLVQWLQYTSIKTLSLEDIMKMLMKVGIGVLVIDNGYLILSELINLGSGVFNLVLDGVSMPSGFACIINKAKNFTFAAACGQIMSDLVPWLIMQFAKVIVYVSAWSRVLELAARTVMAPIGMADLITEGIHGNGMQYLRKYLACCIQGAVIFASTTVYTLACNTIQLNVVTHSALAVVLIVIMFRSKEYSTQITGAA